MINISKKQYEFPTLVARKKITDNFSNLSSNSSSSRSHGDENKLKINRDTSENVRQWKDGNARELGITPRVGNVIAFIVRATEDALAGDVSKTPKEPPADLSQENPTHVARQEING